MNLKSLPVGRPRDSIDTRSMITQPRHRCTRYANIENYDLACIHGDCREIIRILLVPGQAEKWRVCWILVNDGAVLEMPEIKHPH